jgi:hypothetical protein
MHVPNESVRAQCCFALRAASALLLFFTPTSLLTAHEPPQWRSLMAAIDVRNDVHAGEWRRGRDVIEVNAVDRARITLPVAPEGEYDFRVSFTRFSGEGAIVIIFPVGRGQATFEVDAEGEHLAGIKNVDGKPIRDNPTRAKGFKLRNGQRYTMTIEVRDGEVRGLLDGKVIVTYETDGDDLSVAEEWEIPKTDHLGLGAAKSATAFHAIEFRGVEKEEEEEPEKVDPDKANADQVASDKDPAPEDPLHLQAS